MRGVEGKAGTRRFGFSYILLVIAIVIYLGVSAYSALAAEWKAKAEVPQIDPILKIIKGLRQYQQVTASFPQTFDEVEARVWKHPNAPSYGSGGHTLVLKNYYYLYTWISPTRCTLWAVPLGSHASDANSYFLVLTPTDREKFKGPALDLKEASTINGIPTYNQLALLGMIKQDDPPPPPKKR
jgi:hypothetical protein